jgi:NitT/TauT family transport system ATP-binding protein
MSPHPPARAVPPPAVLEYAHVLTPADIMIDVRNVSKTYVTRTETVEAIRSASFLVRRGEFIAILGPSGCGKSTLMLIIAGLLGASAGQVFVAGHEVTQPQTDVGIVFQRPVLLDWRKALGNVLVQVELRRQDPREFEVRARHLLESAGLGGFENKYPFELSGGMQQRVSICRALVHNPPLLMMDEPFGALDALTREQMRIDVERLMIEEQKTVVFVTHSIPEAVQLADRVIVMGPRPSIIERTVEIDLPRPRHRAVKESSHFLDYVKEITDVFMARGILHD